VIVVVAVEAKIPTVRRAVHVLVAAPGRARACRVITVGAAFARNAKPITICIDTAIF
jgi:hypothetical protein